MTREEKKQILEDALTLAYTEVKHAGGGDMDSEAFQTLLRNIETMNRMVEWQLAPRVLAQPETEGTGVAEPQNQEAPDAPEVPDEPAPEAPAVKMEDVRAALAKARGKGVNVSEIIRGFGVETFPQIEKSQYPEVLKKLEEALKNAT